MNDPYVTVCCRADAEGGGIDAAKAFRDAQVLRGIEHLVFLVHGYNNTGAEACTSYRAFCDLQTKLSPLGQRWMFDATVAGFFWPGDARWGIVKAAFYPWAIGVADKAAEVLRDIVLDLLAHNHDELILDFIAHSLGNRLLLRALALLNGTQGLYVRRVVHMAAAVATWKLERGESDQLRSGLLKELAPGQTTSLYSRSDWVLADVFPVGETADLAHEGIAPTALGHDEWMAADARLTQVQATGANHGDYWGGSRKTDPVVRALIQSEVRQALGSSSAATRTVLAYPVPRAEEADPVMTDARTTPVRSAGQSIEDSACAS